MFVATALDLVRTFSYQFQGQYIVYYEAEQICKALSMVVHCYLKRR